jgi:hypothetical protein
LQIYNAFPRRASFLPSQPPLFNKS